MKKKEIASKTIYEKNETLQGIIRMEFEKVQIEQEKLKQENKELERLYFKKKDTIITNSGVVFNNGFGLGNKG